MDNTYEDFVAAVRQVNRLSSIGALLGWDQETYMPPGGGEGRAEQAALISTLAHQRLVSPEMGDYLQALAGPAHRGELPPEAAVNVREVQRLHERASKLPADLVADLARTASRAQQVWAEARKASDFELFRPWLEKTIALQRRAAECYGYEDDVYDALLEEYEPGARVAELQPLFSQLRDEIVPLAAEIASATDGGEPQQLTGRYPAAAQEALVRQVLTRIGFDFQAGRIDISAHPFCTTIASHDVRLTTRYNESDPLEALLGAVHEGGHGLYEQGMDDRYADTPMAQAVSLGIHESQSRLWENLVGRSRPFWHYLLPQFKAAFPGAADHLELEQVYRAVNAVRPSPVRIAADEVTYNLHILLRFELERDLLSDRLAVADLPARWNQRMREYLGLTPPDDAHGVLQDIHWSMGSFGYFPTYTLGNLYSAQFFAAAQRDLPNLAASIAAGEFSSLREWLREHIHRQGMRYRAAELAQRVTGRPLSVAPFVSYLRDKFTELYL